MILLVSELDLGLEVVDLLIGVESLPLTGEVGAQIVDATWQLLCLSQLALTDFLEEMVAFLLEGGFFKLPRRTMEVNT